MKLTFLFTPVTDLAEAVEFHRDELALEEAWRESDDTVAFRLPDHSAQIMLSISGDPAGPMYLVDNLDQWMQDHSTVTVSVPRYAIPGGAVAGFEAPGGNTFYVFDQPDA